MKKALVVLVSATMALTACGGSSSTSTTATTVATTAPKTTEAAESTEAADPREALRDELKQKYDINPSTFVRGDKTGKWRISKVANATPPADYAVDYARAYMEEGDVHYVVNFSLNTTTQYRLLAGIVEAKTTEYVSKEEHDASVIGSGLELTDNYYDFQTGEQITAEADASAGTADTDELIVAVREAADGGIGEADEIKEVTFDGKDLKIIVSLGDSAPFEPRDMALSTLSSITDEILALDDKYYNTWETVTVDFGKVGKATLDKSMVKDQGLGKFFDFPDSALK